MNRYTHSENNEPIIRTERETKPKYNVPNLSMTVFLRALEMIVFEGYNQWTPLGE